MDQTFSWNVRVYYEDTDAGGVVFYANYLKFFERARTEWLRARGIGQHDLAARRQVVFVVKTTTVEYLAPSRLDDELKLTVAIERLGRASVSFVQEAWRQDTDESGNLADRLLARGTITVVCVDLGSFRPIAIPPDILQCIA